MRGIILCLLGALALSGGAAQARGLFNGGVADSARLLLTGGVSNVEGAGGGGLATWAVITGYGSRDALGGNAHFTYVGLPDYALRTFGGAVGAFDWVEVSYARQQFDTGATGAKLGLGQGFTFDQDVVGLKVKLLGDAVYDQDRWYPQVSAGLQYKANHEGPIVRAVGGRHDSGVDYYVAATKLYLDRSLLLNATLRLTKANQFGLLGFGGDRGDGYSAQFEGSAAWLVNRRLALGAEVRTKPDNLGFAKEDAAFDVFAAYALSKHLSLTAAYVDLGDIATFKDQRGFYLSLQAGF